MLGAATTLLMHYPIASLLDALFFVLKGYRLDDPKRLRDIRSLLGEARIVTRHLLSDITLAVVYALVWFVLLFTRKK
jgi:hypothetical protein